MNPEDTVSKFEDKVLELIESVSLTNITLVQGELTRLFKQSEGDDEVRVEQADFAYRFARNIEDDCKALVLLAAALEVSWPRYERGDGYFLEPSLLATFATQLGLSSNFAELLEWSDQLTRCEFLGFFDLGIAANPEATSYQVMESVGRSTIDPVLAIAAASPALTTSQVREALAPLDFVSLLISAIYKEDGISFPEFQDAFGVASSNLKPSEALWEVLLSESGRQLSDSSSEFSWMADFIDQAESCDLFQSRADVMTLIRQNPKLRELAGDSQWEAVTARL